MPDKRSPESRLSNSSADQTAGFGSAMSGNTINPGIRPEELNDNFPLESKPPGRKETRGSGSDRNSDSSRLESPDAYLDKVAEDTFPASDPPSYSPITGVGSDTPTYGEDADTAETSANKRPKSGVSPDPTNRADVEEFKNDPKRQFQYGRKTEASTLHFDSSTNRLNKGNPDVGDVDLGTIEADKPAQPDDLDPYDTADEEDRDPSKEY